MRRHLEPALDALLLPLGFAKRREPEKYPGELALSYTRPRAEIPDALMIFGTMQCRQTRLSVDIASETTAPGMFAARQLDPNAATRAVGAKVALDRTDPANAAWLEVMEAAREQDRRWVFAAGAPALGPAAAALDALYWWYPNDSYGQLPPVPAAVVAAVARDVTRVLRELALPWLERPDEITVPDGIAPFGPPSRTCAPSCARATRAACASRRPAARPTGRRPSRAPSRASTPPPDRRPRRGGDVVACAPR